MGLQQIEQKTYRPPNWDTLTLTQARENQEFHEFLRNPRTHANFIYDGLTQLIGQNNPDEIARILAILNEINVIDPISIGKPHSMVEANRLRRILSRYPHYRQNDLEVYQYLIEELNNGQLGHLQNMLGEKRKQLGIATPFPTELLVSSLSKAAGFNKDFPALTLDEVKALLITLSNIEYPEQLIQQDINASYIFTTTGIGRNVAIRKSFKPTWKNGAYVEVGGSFGVHPLEIKRDIGFFEAVSLDIIPKIEADNMTIIIDYSAGRSISISDELRQEVARGVRRVFLFDARVDDIGRITGELSARPIVIGIHNLLVHLTDKDIVIVNAIRAIKNGHNFLWTSGGYNGNGSVLNNFVLEMNEGEVVNVFTDQYNQERTGGKGVNISSRKEMQEVFKWERAS